MNMYCHKCGESLERLMVYALLTMLGVSISPDPFVCLDGKEHEFIIAQDEEEDR